ncbi:MAG: ATP-binding cassette domain-containing protein [Selenomonadales bacterium]|nr:ATP-binding cassette domain-containing protein [Selenomonadales bacterium]
MSELLLATDIVKTYTTACGMEHTVLKGVDLLVRAGEIVAVMGESGCGKSTLLRIVAGLMRPDSGIVRYDGMKHTAPHPSIQMVFQDAGLSFNRYMTIGESIAEGAERHKTGRTAEGMAQLVGLEGDLLERTPSRLSGGELRRAALARALAMNPRVLLADELTSGLDLTVQAGLLNLLLRLAKEEHLAIVLVSHDENVVRHLADRVIVIENGKVAVQGTIEDLEAKGYL